MMVGKLWNQLENTIFPLKLQFYYINDENEFNNNAYHIKLLESTEDLSFKEIKSANNFLNSIELNSISTNGTYSLINEKMTYGIIGTFNINKSLYIIIVTQVEMIDKLLNREIYKIKKIELIHIDKNDKFGKNASLTGELSYHKDLLESGGFLFSYEYSIWNHLQYNSKNNNNNNWLTDSKDKYRFKRYIWNQHLFKSSDEMECQWLLKLIRGHFETKKIYDGIIISIIARIDTRNAGTRFTTRGLNLNGSGAITVENEFIINTNVRVASYLQLRSSFPLIWSQKTNKFSYKPPVIIQKIDDQVKKAIKNHFKDIQDNVLSGQIDMINLLRENGDERKLTTTFEEYIQREPIEYLSLKSIPLGWGTQCLFYLMDQITEPLKAHGYFLAELNKDSNQIKKVLNKQVGIFRTNCMDCIDRTSIAQFGILRRLLPCLLNSVIMPQKTDTICLRKLSEIETLYALPALRSLFADHANSIADYYTGTGIVNEAIIRDGANCQRYSWKDQIVCGTRYYLNNTYDLTKKRYLDRYLALHYLNEVPEDRYQVSIKIQAMHEHILMWQRILGNIPSVGTLAISSSKIERMDKVQMAHMKTLYAANLLKLTCFSAYCEKFGLDSDVLLSLIPYFESNL